MATEHGREQETDGKTAGRPIADIFSLDPHEADTLRSLLAEALLAEGIDSDTLLDALFAGQSLGAAIGLTGPAIELLYARAHGWFAIDRIDRAEPLFRVLCIADGGTADHWVGHGVCLRARDEIEGAAIAFRMAAALRPHWALPQFHLGCLAARCGDTQAARHALDLFDARADGETPPAMRFEAARLRTVLDTGSP